MATVILPSAQTQTNQVPEILLEAVLHEADPNLDGRPDAYTRALAAILRPACERMVEAYQEADKLVARVPTAHQAFQLFLINMVAALQDGRELENGCGTLPRP